MKIARSSIVTAFDPRTIGTKVTDAECFMSMLRLALRDYTFPANGQGFVTLHPDTCSMVSCGVAPIDDKFGEGDFRVRKYRGQWSVFAARKWAAAVTRVECVVYTISAYLSDPDVHPHEREVLEANGAEYVLVAVLAHSSDSSPLGPNTLIHNIAGGNASFIPLTEAEVLAKGPDHNLALLDEIVAQAKESEKYWSRWMVVAD